MTNEGKAKAIAEFLSIDVETLHKKSCYLGAREMARWKDEKSKKDLLELEAKNDVLESCLRDAKSEIKTLQHRIEVEKTYRMQIEKAVRSLPNSVKDLIKAFNMMI